MAKAFADRWGVPVRAGSADAVALLDAAIEDLAALAGDPVADADAAVAADDSLVLGHIYRAYLQLYGTTPEGVAAAGEILERLDETFMGEREASPPAAARHWAEGDWEATTRSLERALLCHPRDLLALKVAQDLYFFLGNRLELRDTAARVLPAWPRDLPGWGYVQGIYAFGLEENADYRQAESRARAALDHNPRDVWSVHALAHVFEMEGSQRDGVDFLTASAPDWSASYFAIHNWWHRGLYHLELGEIGEALALYDDPIRAGPVHRVARRGGRGRAAVAAVAVRGGRDRARRAARGRYRRPGQQPRLHLQRLARGDGVRPGRRPRADRAGDRGEPAPVRADQRGRRRAGRPGPARGVRRVRRRPSDRAIDLLIDIRPRANAVGGSHAQRDVIDLTLIAAAARAGDDGLARALVAERVARKPSAEAAARQLITENGGSLDALRWQGAAVIAIPELSTASVDRVCVNRWTVAVICG